MKGELLPILNKARKSTRELKTALAQRPRKMSLAQMQEMLEQIDSALGRGIEDHCRRKPQLNPSKGFTQYQFDMRPEMRDFILEHTSLRNLPLLGEGTVSSRALCYLARLLGYTSDVKIALQAALPDLPVVEKRLTIMRWIHIFHLCRVTTDTKVQKADLEGEYRTIVEKASEKIHNTVN